MLWLLLFCCVLTFLIERSRDRRPEDFLATVFVFLSTLMFMRRFGDFMPRSSSCIACLSFASVVKLSLGDR